MHCCIPGGLLPHPFTLTPVAGGGLLTDSVMKQEWEETEAKLHTMRSMLQTEES